MKLSEGAIAALAAFFFVLASSGSASAEKTYSLLHRSPSASTKWSERAKIYLEPGSAPRYEETESGARHLPADTDTGDIKGIYQLALVSDSSKKAVDERTPMTFAKLCHLSARLTESITLHLDEAQSAVHGISYHFLGLDVGPHGCPLEASSLSTASQPSTHVKVATPQDALLPPPRGPPPTKADGTPLKEGEAPPKEKSFVAKYWYYFVPILILMALPTEMADSANEEEENGGGSDMPLMPAGGGGGSSGGGGGAGRGGKAKGGAGARRR